MDTDQTYKEALKYHAQEPNGKISVNPTKPCITSRDLTLAYSPGVAAPCLAIHEKPEDVYKYTSKGNLVAVISNGSAVLGLGNIGPLASKPVMEGKGVLFKRFAGIDVFDIEISEETIDGVVKVVSSLEPTFGGVNLEDIKAPECFEIEKQLVEKMNIPVFHDDQHGTAIISSAAFLNALEVTDRKIEETKVVFTGAGAASISCARLLLKLGLKPQNLIMTDKEGVIYTGRKSGMNVYKSEFALDTPHRTLSDAIKGADAFIGCSTKKVLKPEMVKSMAKNPIIFAMANPEPEILPELAKEVRPDCIIATGRSDYPNQVNNVLGFPFIFRGALDVRAKKINEEMKIAAVHALAKLAKEQVTDEVRSAYGLQDFNFGPEYLIPKPFDTRVLTSVAPAVAKAAMDSGVARVKIKDFDEYRENLKARIGSNVGLIRHLSRKLPKRKKIRIVYPEGSSSRILTAVNTLVQEGKIEPILIGNKNSIQDKIKTLNFEKTLKDIEIIDPKKDERFTKFSDEFFKMRQRKGVTSYQARDLMSQRNYFGSMLVKKGHADGLVTGASQNYPDAIKPLFQIIGTKNKTRAHGVIVLLFENKTLFLSDCTMQIDPTAEEVKDITISTVNYYKSLIKKNPRVALVSYSSFGSNNHPSAHKMKKALSLIKEAEPELIVDGEMQADLAINTQLREKLSPFSALDKDADILILPNLSAANISYKLLAQLGKAKTIGPILLPMNESTQVVQRTSTASQIVNMSIMAAVSAFNRKSQTVAKKEGKKEKAYENH